MKFSSTLTIFILQATASVALTTTEAEILCGDRGVMHVDLDKLPTGVDPTAIRQCASAFSPSEKSSIELVKRNCWVGPSSSGCSQEKKRCWKSCGVQGSGQWCWTALNGGYGDWISCSSDSQCNTSQACGIGLDCEDCGCSC